LVGRLLIFLIDSRWIWYGCLALKPIHPTAEDPEIQQSSIKSDRAASYSSCTVYEMSHFRCGSKSKLKLDLTDASHFILLILSFCMPAQLPSSSLNLLR
jgi:hypothetical protein